MKHEIKIPKSVLQNFAVDYSSSNNEVLVLRTSIINTDKEAFDFVRTFGNMTGCQYILNFTNPNPTRIVYHTSWICRFSKRNKVPGSLNNKNCEATLSYKIKKIGRSGHRDAFMNEVPPKPGILKIKLFHSHRLDPPKNIEYVIWSEEMKKPIEEPSDGSDSVGSLVIKEEIESDCDISDTGLPDIYQLPLKRKSYHPLTRMGRPPLDTHRSKESSDDTSNSVNPKSDQNFPTLSEESLTVPVTTSSEASKSEPTVDKTPKFNIFVFQVKPGSSAIVSDSIVKPGTTPLVSNFKDKPGNALPLPDIDAKSGTRPILPKFGVKTGAAPLILKNNVESGTPSIPNFTTSGHQNSIPTSLFFSPSQNVITSTSDKTPQMLFTNVSSVAQNSYIIKSEAPTIYPLPVSNTVTSLNTTKSDEFLSPVISSITSQQSGESIDGSFPSLFNKPDPNNNSKKKLINSPMSEGLKNNSPIKFEPVENSLTKPIRKPKFEDLELYKNLLSGSEEVNPLEIDGEQYIPKEISNLDIYGLHVAERLRKLDQKTREFVQKSIDGLLFDAEIGLGNFTYEKSQCSKSSTDSPSTTEVKSDTFDSESTWSALSDQAESYS